MSAGDPHELEGSRCDLGHAEMICGAELVQLDYVTRGGRAVRKVWVCNRPRWVDHTEHRVTDHRAIVRKSWSSP